MPKSVLLMSKLITAFSVVGVFILFLGVFLLFTRNQRPINTSQPTAPSSVSVSPQGNKIAGDLVKENQLLKRNDILYFGDFTGKPWTSTMHANVSASHYTIIPRMGYGETNALRAYFQKGSYGSNTSPVGTSSTIFRIPFGMQGANIGTSDNLYFRYLVKFEPGFQFAKSGKMPGLAGGADNAGGNPPNGFDGWSGRLNWTEGGGIISYMYVPGIKKYGLELQWNINDQIHLLRPGYWECLEMHYAMNTPGQNNGVAQGWYNGKLALDKRDLNFRSTDKLAIDNIFFSTFFGGATSDYASPRNQYADYSDFVVATNYIGCPS